VTIADEGIAVSTVDGGPALAVAPRALAELASLDRMEVTLPPTRAGDGTAALTIEGARRRRGRLRAAVITVDAARLSAAFAPRALAELGISELRLALAEGYVRLRAHAKIKDREADFTARVRVSPASRRRVRVTIDDVRVYGFLPLPAPLVGGTVLAASAASGDVGSRRATLQAHWTLELDVLDLAVYETFASGGFRLPDISSARLDAVRVEPTGITLAWDGDADRPGAEAAEITSTSPRVVADADQLLASGDVAGALEAYRAAARAGEADADRRVLEVLVASPGTLGDAATELARLAALAPDTPDTPTLTLAAAVIAAERGDPAVAARAYMDAGAAAAALGEGDDADLARLAAASEWLRAGKAEEARPLLEAVLSDHPDDARAAELFQACSTDLTRREALPPEAAIPPAEAPLPAPAQAEAPAAAEAAAPAQATAPREATATAEAAAPAEAAATVETAPPVESDAAEVSAPAHAGGATETAAPLPELPDDALAEAPVPALPDAALEPATPEPLPPSAPQPAASLLLAAPPASGPAASLPAPPAPEPAPPVPAPPLSMTQPATVLAVALAEAELAESSNRPEAAAKALRRALDLVPPRDAGRADLARRLAAAYDLLGDDDGALGALRQYLDAAGAGPAVAPAWRRLVELYARRGDPQAAARALIASADDPRTGSNDEARGAALTAAAEILRKRLGLAEDAVMLLERAIALDPRSIETLDALQTTAVESSNWERLADVLERKVDLGARGPLEQKDLLVQLAEVYDRQLQRPGRARDTHERALQLDPRFQPSLTWLARDAWVRGDSAAGVELYGRLAATEANEPRLAADLRAEAHVRLGLLARRAGDDGAAEREADRALAAVPAHPAALDLLIDLLESQARHGELSDALARRIATDLGAAARSDLQRRRAHALERAGRVVESAALWRGLVEHDVAALPALRRLADTLRAADDSETLFAVLEPLGEALVITGDLAGADQIFAARVQLAADAATAGVIATERARLRLAADDGLTGAASALEVLREVAPAAMPEDGLVLRADLGEQQASLDDALPALEELRARARAAAHAEAIAEYERRIAEVVARLGEPAPRTEAELEQALAANPTDAGAAEELAVLYAQIPEARERAEALAGLLRRALGLPPDRRKAIYAVLGESAEASGDLERAEQAYWRAATIEAEPALRANYLVSHARVLLARGEVQTAMSELEEAIARVPHHAGALALLADLTFRTQDWTRARQLYAELEVAPDAALAIARETLVHRRAVLADAQGDSADAEAFYRELAILNPRHAEARRALAEIALHRGDFGAAAVRLEEVLRLLPTTAAAELLDTRQRLGAVYVQLGDWGSARYTLELVLAQDPTRQGSLELLVEVYERLGLFKEAAAACVRLARLNFDPTRRAAILYRQGEILRAHLGDDAGAFDAYLKSSDLDPRFVPTMVRLVPYFWGEGDFGSLGDIATDLEAAGFSPDDDLELAVELALGSAFAKPERRARWSLRGRPFDAAVAARALAQLGAAAPKDTQGATAEALDTALDTVVEWAGPAPADAPLVPALAELVAQDPAGAGALRVLARQAERTGSKVLARAAYALRAHADPGDEKVAERLRALGPAAAATSSDLRVDGPADHPGASGPLRRALAALAVPLLGLGDEPSVVAGALAPARAEELRRLGDRLGAPDVEGVVEKSDVPAVKVVASGAKPTQLRVTSAAAALPDAAWSFLVARALEEARSGLAGLRRLPPGDRTLVLEGAQAALLGETPDGARARDAARLVNDAVETLPPGAARQRLVADLREILSSPPDWEAFGRAAAHTANRVGLLACGDPAVALAALAREDVAPARGGGAKGAGAKDAAAREAEARRAFLRTEAVRELVRFMLSPAYASAVARDQ
jgi:tetratricopeptide (TPR) repeat protein